MSPMEILFSALKADHVPTSLEAASALWGMLQVNPRALNPKPCKILPAQHLRTGAHAQNTNPQNPNFCVVFAQGDGSINVREGLNGMAQCWEDMASVLMFGTLKLEVVEGEKTWDPKTRTLRML